MFKLTTDENKGFVGYTDKVNYVKFNKQNGCFDSCTRDEAELVIFKNKKYNFPLYMMNHDGKKYDEEAPVIYIVERDGFDIVFEQGVLIESQVNNLGDLEEYVCNIDTGTSSRFDDIETMLCELDSKSE